MIRDLSVKEAAAESGLSESTIWRLVQDKSLETYRIRRRRFITRASFERLRQRSNEEAA